MAEGRRRVTAAVDQADLMAAIWAAAEGNPLLDPADADAIDGLLFCLFLLAGAGGRALGATEGPGDRQIAAEYGIDLPPLPPLTAAGWNAAHPWAPIRPGPWW